jgi:hypothetical protein
MMRKILVLLISLPLATTVMAWSSSTNRRDALQKIVATVPIATTLTQAQPAVAYTPDSDPLRESLYLMSRVQEATVQQERFVNKATDQIF